VNFAALFLKIVENHAKKDEQAECGSNVSRFPPISGFWPVWWGKPFLTNGRKRRKIVYGEVCVKFASLWKPESMASNT
jgi:hypothetical protein